MAVELSRNALLTRDASSTPDAVGTYMIIIRLTIESKHQMPTNARSGELILGPSEMSPILHYLGFSIDALLV